MMIRFRTLPFALAWSLLGSFGCGASWLAYDPTGAVETGGCISDADCAAGSCDVAVGRCRMCLNDGQCAEGKACVEGVCVAAPGRCRSDADCDDEPGLPRCQAATGRCVACLDETDCGGRACNGGTCAVLAACTPATPPPGRVQVGSLLVSKAEVSADDYAACVAAGCCEPASMASGCSQPGAGLPANCLSHRDASLYCAYVGGRLPSGGEWTLLAGGGGELFPWGAAPGASCSVAIMADASGAACGGSGPAAACSLAAGNTPAGLCDVGGNLWEWTQEAGADGTRVLRGGSFSVQNPELLRNSFRGYAEAPTLRLADGGVRCVW